MFWLHLQQYPSTIFATGKLHNALPPLCTQPQPPFVLKTTHFSKQLLFKDEALLFLTWTLSCLVLTEKKRVSLHPQIYMFHTPLQNLYLAFILTLWPKGIQQIVLNINFKDYCYVIPGSGYMNLAPFCLKCMCASSKIGDLVSVMLHESLACLAGCGWRYIYNVATHWYKRANEFTNDTTSDRATWIVSSEADVTVRAKRQWRFPTIFPPWYDLRHRSKI